VKCPVGGFVLVLVVVVVVVVLDFSVLFEDEDE